MTTTPTDPDLAELWRVADKATPGPWKKRVIDDGDRHFRIQYRPELAVAGTYNGLAASDNAAFIAAWNPATALALLDHIDGLQAELDRARADKGDHNEHA